VPAVHLRSWLRKVGNLTSALTASNFSVFRVHSNANKKVIDKQCTFMLFSPVFATRKSRPSLLAPLPFLPSAHASLFLSEVCALSSVTGLSQPFVYQSLRHSFHRDGECTPYPLFNSPSISLNHLESTLAKVYQNKQLQPSLESTLMKNIGVGGTIVN